MKKEKMVECPVFGLYKVSRNLIKIYTQHLEPLELTYPQYLAMLYLWENKEASVDEIGGALMLDSGTLTPLLKRLQAKGFLTRARDPKDERRCVISLTEEGIALELRVGEVRKEVSEHFNIGPDLIKRLKNVLNEILEGEGNNKDNKKRI